MSKEEELTETSSLKLTLLSLLPVVSPEELFHLTESSVITSKFRELQSLPSEVISSLTEVSVPMVPPLPELASEDLPSELVLVPVSLMDLLSRTVAQLLVLSSKVSTDLSLEPFTSEDVVVSVSEDVVLASEDVASVEDSEESTAAVMALVTIGDQFL